MSVLISLHAASLARFLHALAKDRLMSIAKMACDQRVLSRLHLVGNEERPFTDQEIQKILTDYEFFKPFFISKGLWPIM